MKKQPERTAMTRNILISTFLELSKQKETNKITVAELSQKAGYNRSTFYQYFNDTQHLLTCIEDELLLYIKETIVSRIGAVHSTQLFIDSFIRINVEKGAILKLLLDKGGNNTFPAKLKETLIPLFAIKMNLPADDPQTIYKLDFYLSGVIAILSRWVTSDNPLSPEEYGLLMKEIVEGIQKATLFPNL